jgi:hypothetical protein
MGRTGYPFKICSSNRYIGYLVELIFYGPFSASDRNCLFTSLGASVGSSKDEFHRRSRMSVASRRDTGLLGMAWDGTDVETCGSSALVISPENVVTDSFTPSTMQSGSDREPLLSLRFKHSTHKFHFSLYILRTPHF